MMALPPPGETESQDKAGCPPAPRQPLAAYYAPFSCYSHCGNLAAAEEDFQPRKLAAAGSASQAVAPLDAFRMAPPLQSEPLYQLPWYNKLSPWYPIPRFAPEVPRFLYSTDCGSSSQNLVPVGGQSNREQWWGAENLLLPSPGIASLPTDFKTCQSISAPQTLNREGKLPLRGFSFTEEELRFVLYGTIASAGHPAGLHHAISGVLVPTDGSGKEICIWVGWNGSWPRGV